MKKLILFISILLFITSFLFSQTSVYKVSGTIDIGGEGRWDYTAVDVPMHTLFVSHGNRVARY